MGMPERSAASRRLMPAAMRASLVAAASAFAMSGGVTMFGPYVTRWLQRNPTRRESSGGRDNLRGYVVYQLWKDVLFLVVDMRERSPWSDAVAAQVRAELAASGMTQGEAAQAAGMARATFNRIAQGGRVADVSQLAHLCAVWNLPLSEFFRRAEERVSQHGGVP